MEGDAAYFGRRARDEYAAAMRAEHLNARQAHVELAKRYSALAHEIERHQFAWGIGQSDDPLLGRDFCSSGGSR